MDNADDDTIRQLPEPRWPVGDPTSVPGASTTQPGPGRLRSRWLTFAMGGVVVAVGMFVLYWSLPLYSPSVVKTAPADVAVTASEAAESPYALASESEILGTRSERLTVFRLAANPAILVFDFPTMHEQARMLNRIAVMIETRGQSRDHALGDDALEQVVRATGAELDSFYDGHDYRAGDVVRFFQTAARDGIRLNPEEIRLHGILDAAGWFTSGNAPYGALISIPTMGVGADADARAVVLRHEISHGEFFTNPRYVEHTRRFWQNDLTAAEREGFRHFLTGQQYDPDNEDLMMNETQAYLIHTPDPRFFKPAMAGMTDERGRQLQALFMAAMPSGWLRDLVTRPPSRAPAARDAR